MNKKTTKKAPKKAAKAIKEAEKALKEFDDKARRIEEINESLKSRNYSEAVDFMMRFSLSKDCQKLIQVLSNISEQPQIFRGKTEFDTIYSVAMIDGERSLFRKFMQVVASANEGDRMKVEQQINRNSIA